jgi:hypothetical protein
MHNEIEFSFVNLLIMSIGLLMTYWMSRAPKSVLKLMNNRYPALKLDKDRPWLTSLTRNFGRFTFFMLVNGILLTITPSSLANMTGVSLLSLSLAIGISVLALRTANKKNDQSATP